MDPDTTLTEIRELLARQDSPEGFGGLDTIRLIERVEALDTWLSNGGHLPAAWIVNRQD
ncbi:hypothetical protein ACFYON_16335 [Micromonospora sp. NPDC005686]|uniref:hypothetical protein n=1 Tax=Micromonospora sp. NPDC005686 TaxID=3364233 RepID=UPI00368B39BA